MSDVAVLFGRKFVNLALFRHAVAVALILSTFITSTALADPLGYRAVAPLTPTLHVRSTSSEGASWAPSLRSLPSLPAAPSHKILAKVARGT